jgi:3-oxoacyl-[acyl-carrier protein] reductase
VYRCIQSYTKVAAQELRSVEPKVAVVTGASRGLGRRIAETLARAGAHVVLTGRPGPGSPLSAVADGITAAGGGATAFHGDVADEKDVRALADLVTGRFGRVDVLVNNAAVRLPSRLLDTTVEELDHFFGVNVRGPFLMWRHLVPAMVARHRGNVINVCSTNAPTQPFFGMAPYRMTKVALTYLSADRRYGVTVPYHAQDGVEVLDEPIRGLAAQTADSFTGRFVRRVDFGRTWGPTARLDQSPMEER